MLLAVTLTAGLAVHGALPDVAATDMAGDVLYALAVYLVVVLAAPRASPWTAGGIAAAWGIAVELFQLTGIPGRLAGTFPPSVLVLGTVFDPRDLVIAVVVPLVAAGVDAGLARARRSRASARSRDDKLVG